MLRNEEPLEKQFRASGLKCTAPRRLIAQVLFEARDHPDAPEVYRRVAGKDDRISLATVYRTLKRLEALGMIERHSFRSGRARFAKVSNEHHGHLIDINSGRVIEFRNLDIERLQAEIARQLGYRLIGHCLALYAVPRRGAEAHDPRRRIRSEGIAPELLNSRRHPVRQRVSEAGPR